MSAVLSVLDGLDEEQRAYFQKNPEIVKLVAEEDIATIEVTSWAYRRCQIQVYEEMARRQLEEIREEAMARFGVEEIAIIHRYGSFDVSDNIMMIAVGGGHRPETFEACRWVLEEIKKKVPIWKKEITPEGGFWVEGDEP